WPEMLRASCPSHRASPAAGKAALRGLEKLKLGMIVLGALWLAVAATLMALWTLDTLAGLMFIPYLMWVTVAGALNLSVIRLNPEIAQNG
ncbi:MAG: TspO/MBR family protein, partial [Pseudomonadota bacterium]